MKAETAHNILCVATIGICFLLAFVFVLLGERHKHQKKLDERALIMEMVDDRIEQAWSPGNQ